MEHLDDSTVRRLRSAVLMSPALDEAIVGVVETPAGPRAIYDYDRVLGLVEVLLGPRPGDAAHRLVGELAARCRRIGERAPVIAQALGRGVDVEDLDVLTVAGSPRLAVSAA